MVGDTVGKSRENKDMFLSLFDILSFAVKLRRNFDWPGSGRAQNVCRRLCDIFTCQHDDRTADLGRYRQAAVNTCIGRAHAMFPEQVKDSSCIISLRSQPTCMLDTYSLQPAAGPLLAIPRFSF